MKVITRRICGEERVLCYSLRVSKAVAEKFGAGGIRDALQDGDTEKTLDAVIWLLVKLMKAGKRYADKNGQPCPEPPDEDDMLDDYSLDDLADLYGVANDTMAAGAQQEVEAESKNAEATQDR
jgi:hypothetical protein